MATFLLELFSEEIPSRMQAAAAEQLSRLVTGALQKAGIAHGEAKSFVSPRHLALQVFGLAQVQPDVSEERRGPKVGAPEQALKGFLSSTGLTLEQCEQRDGYYYATIHKKGGDTSATLAKIIPELLGAFAWPKSMRWGAHSMQWVRPLHGIIALLDAAVIPLQFAHLTASNVTQGHRFLSPAPITITHAEHYEKQLAAAHVLVDFAARRQKIHDGVAALAAQQKLQLVEDDALLNEVTGLVEWPVPLLGTFEEKFLDLPPEVLISEMKNHQRYFALRQASGKLANQFITVANMVNADGGKMVMAGNSRVVRARLSDGEFYWNQDRLSKLEDWGKKLSDVVFHAQVGMMDAKVARIEALAVAILSSLSSPSGGALPDEKSVRRAAQLCKADLTSGMVGEFPELQGIMGRYYALAQGESAEIADAIRDHYKPLGAADSVPESPLAAIIAVADKLDSIVSLFAAGEKPTGSKDPLALRRAALGVLRIILEFKFSFDFRSILIEAMKSLEAAEVNTRNEIFFFFVDRIRVYLKETYKISHECSEAILNRYINHIDEEKFEINLLSLKNECAELEFWLATDSGVTTLAAIKRASNILSAEEKKSKTLFAAKTDGTFTHPAEKALADALKQVDSRLRGNDKAPEMLEALTAPIDIFFDREKGVQVTEEGHREARLGLLAAVRDAANIIADFSKLEG